MSAPRKRERDDVSSNGINKRRYGEDVPVSTLFVSGLPSDVRERELRLLASFLPGLEGAVISRGRAGPRGESQIGFIKFTSQNYAMAAAHALQGYQFDEEDPESHLRVSLAKRDMNIRSRTSASSYQERAYAANYGGFPGFQPYGGAAAAAMYGGAEASMAAYGQMAQSMAAAVGMGSGAAPETTAFTFDVRRSDDVLDTLCIRGLTNYTSQADLQGYFGNMTGFRDMKLFENKGLAFIAFQDAQHAQHCLTEIEGKTIELPGTTGRETVLVEYARRSLE